MTTTRKTPHAPAATHTTAPPTPVTSAPKSPDPPSATAATATTGSSVMLIAPPPQGAVIPVPPNGVVATDGSAYRGVLPKTSQLAVMGAAVAELGRFADYAQVFGRTAPALPSITQSFDAANQWSLMRVRTIAWSSYCLEQEGLAWIDVRKLMDQLQPAFALAVKSDAAIGTQFPNLAKLFDAQRTIAQAAAATRKANKKLVAEGKPPIKGKVGKKRQRNAARAALLATSAAPSPATNAPAPQPATPTPVAAVATNGVAHS